MADNNSEKDREITERVRRWTVQRNWSKTDLAVALGVTPGAVSNWLRVKNPRPIPPEKHRSIADAFGRSLDELVGNVPERKENFSGTEIATFAGTRDYSLARIPVRWTAHTDTEGYWTQQQQPVGTGDGFINMPSRDRDAYAIRIFDDSTHSRVRSGEYVIIEPNHPLVPGDEVLVRLKDGRAMIRDFLFQRDGKIVVQNIRGQRSTFADSEIEKVEYVSAIAKHALFTPSEIYGPV